MQSSLASVILCYLTSDVSYLLLDRTQLSVPNQSCPRLPESDVHEACCFTASSELRKPQNGRHVRSKWRHTKLKIAAEDAQIGGKQYSKWRHSTLKITAKNAQIVAYNAQYGSIKRSNSQPQTLKIAAKNAQNCDKGC